MAVTDTQRYELREIIAALDRCRPRHDETGEATIARDAAALQIKAVARLTALLESYKARGRSTPGPERANDVAVELFKP